MKKRMHMARRRMNHIISELNHALLLAGCREIVLRLIREEAGLRLTIEAAVAPEALPGIERMASLLQPAVRNPALVETIVTTDMAKALAADYGVALLEVLTGFKYIGRQIRRFEEEGSFHYVFGLEESYGCLAGTYARDKDACVAVMLLCEAAAYYKTKGKTLWDAMTDMYEKYGYYKEGLATLTLKGIDGAKQIQDRMSRARSCPPQALGAKGRIFCL